MAGLYISIAPTRLTGANFGGDGGDFLAAILTRGIPHPTGYPTYTLLGILFQALPISTPVFRGVLESLIPAALAAGLLAGWVGFVLPARSAPHLCAVVVAGCSWGVAPLLYSQAVIVEVHGLQSLIGVLALWLITLNLSPNPGQYSKWTLGLSLLVGLGLGNHVMGLLLFPALVLSWFILIRRTRSWKIVILQVLLVLVGLLVYLYLPLRARLYPAINWGNPQSWSGFVWEISGSPYHGLLFGARSTALWERVRSVFSLLMGQFGPVGLVAGVIGALQYTFSIKWIRWILVWIFGAYFIFSIGYNTQDSLEYLIPAIMVFAIWIGMFIPSLWSVHWRQLPMGLILAGVLVLATVWRVPATRARLDPRSLDSPANYAEQLLANAPSRAIVFTTTDEDTFPLWYYHFGLHQRPDVRIITLPLTQFVWYQETLGHIYPDLSYPAIYPQDLPNVDWGQQIAGLNPGRPVCNTHISADSDTGVSYQCVNP